MKTWGRGADLSWHHCLNSCTQRDWKWTFQFHDHKLPFWLVIHFLKFFSTTFSKQPQHFTYFLYSPLGAKSWKSGVQIARHALCRWTISTFPLGRSPCLEHFPPKFPSAPLPALCHRRCGLWCLLIPWLSWTLNWWCLAVLDRVSSQECLLWFHSPTAYVEGWLLARWHCPQADYRLWLLIRHLWDCITTIHACQIVQIARSCWAVCHRLLPSDSRGRV